MAADSQPQPKVIEHPQYDESSGFDYRVHVKDAKTGRLIRIQNYARHSRGSEVLLERPPGSGNMFAENGKPAGRWDAKTWTKIADAHIATADAPINREELLEQENDALQKELAALRAEGSQAQQQLKKPAVQKD